MANRYRSSVLAGALILSTAGTGRADRSITLDDALAMARAHNRDLRAARERIVEAEAGVAQARAALLPTVSAQGKYTRNYKEVDFNAVDFVAPTFDIANAIATSGVPQAEAAAINAAVARNQVALGSQPAVVIQKLNQLDGTVSAAVPLVAPPAYYGLSAAESSRDASAAGYQVTEAGVLLSVAQAYFAAAGTDELVRARQDAVKVATETFDVAKARVAAELANQVESMRAETALVRAQQDLTEAENRRGQAYRALATLIGTHEPIAVQAPVTLPAEPGAVDALVGEARARRPEIAAERATIAAASASAKADAWRWSPVLSAFGFARDGNYTGFSGDKYAWGVGLQLDWLLYDGGVRDAQRHIAQAQRREAEARLDLLTDTVSDEVADARGTLETSRKAVGAAQRAVELASETLRLIRAQYEAGTARQLDVLQAQDVLVGAEVALAQAHFDVALADLQLRRAAGEFPGRAAR
ncbi:MAG TPA: TolC family protein [Kofleriaceae bacterium]|jgi:outer membrane protein TolC|nr:TolC family protein [Kofleriaceae bacterium]